MKERRERRKQKNNEICAIGHTREEALVAVWDGLPADELAGFQQLATRLADGLEAYHAEVERGR